MAYSIVYKRLKAENRKGSDGFSNEDLEDLTIYLLYERYITPRELYPDEVLADFKKVLNKDYNLEDYPTSLWRRVQTDQQGHKLLLMR